MENVVWIFEGIGTSIFTLVIGVLFGGLAGYKICSKKNNAKLTQKARDNAVQSQVVSNKNDQ